MSSKLYHLTRQQQGLWVESKRNENDISYNTCVQVELEGKIDVARFQDSASAAVKHFDMLHSVIVEKDLKPFLKFSEEEYHLEFVDFSDKNQRIESLRKKALQYLDNIRLKPIALDKFPLINACLVKISEEHFFFIGVVPHIISDGVSATMFLQSLSECYNNGQDALEEKFSYKDVSWPCYLKFLDEKYPKEKIDEAYDYWQENLANANHIVKIGNKPCKRNSNLGKRFKFDAGLDVFVKLKKIARANKTGFFSVISASLAAFIKRYYNIDEMLLGYPVNLRPAGYKNAFGFYVNVLPLKIDFADDDNFNNLVQKAHQARKSDKKYQYLPSIDVVRAKRKSDPKFDGQICNISMAQTVSRLQNLNLDNVKSTSLDNETIEIKDDLSLIYEVGEDGISFWFEYLLEIFDEKQIAAMSRHFINLLEEMAAKPDKLISLIDIVNKDEKLLSLGKKVDFAGKDLVSEFSQIVKKYPTNIALLDGDDEISYLELDERSNKLAKYLTLNIDQDQEFIALLLPFGVDRIVAILAVLKAGFAYVPIEPDSPLKRVEIIVGDAGIKNIIAFDKVDIRGLNSIILNDISLEDSSFKPKIKDLAYLIYTSGSTGKPKGVMVEHDKVVARINWLKNTFKITTNNKVLQSTSYSFDVSVAEIFWPLLSGATLVIIDEAKRKDFKYLLNLVLQKNIDAACMVPSALMALLKFAGKNTNLPFKYLLSAGEALTPEIIKKYYEHGQDSTLFNIYGPTEAVIYSSCALINKNDEVTIGGAIDATRLYVLNKDLKMQPKNAFGELFIGGDILAKGYLNRDDLNQEKFIKDPFSNGLMYKSGDLVSFDDDLNIKYFGRIDSQVKIRGYRIEIGEIESRLNEIGQISEARVVLNDKSQLIAAISLNDEISDEEIKQYLAQFLPNYMVVQFIVRFNKLPKLPSSKIDTKSIIAEINNRLHDDIKQDELILPKSKNEKIMAKIWSDILRINLNKIGVNSNFFALGGDSLMVIELECLAQEHGIYLDNSMIFSDPTIVGLLKNSSDKPFDKIKSSKDKGVVRALPRQEKFLADSFKKPHIWNRIISVEAKKKIDIDKLRQAFLELLDFHDLLRACVDDSVNFDNKGSLISDDKLLLKIADKVEPQIDVFDLDNQKSAEVEGKIVEILNGELAKFDLKKAPLIKIVVIKFKKKTRISLIVHHLLVDIRSIRIILEDLMGNFLAKIQGKKFEFIHKTSSITDYVEAMDEHLDNNNFDEEINYWLSELDDVGGLEGEVRNCDLKTIFKVFSKKQTKNLLNLANENNVNIQELLLSKLAQSYKKQIGGNNLTLNICFHGRDQFFKNININKTIGWFNTVFPIKIAINNPDAKNSNLENINSEKSNLEKSNSETLDSKNLDSKNLTNLALNIKNKLENIPNRSLNYLPLRYVKKDKKLNSKPEPKIFFNYVSKIDRELPKELNDKLPLKIIEDQNLKTIDDKEKSTYELYIEAALVDEKLQLKISYLAQPYEELVNNFTNFGVRPLPFVK